MNTKTVEELLEVFKTGPANKDLFSNHMTEWSRGFVEGRLMASRHLAIMVSLVLGYELTSEQMHKFLHLFEEPKVETKTEVKVA